MTQRDLVLVPDERLRSPSARISVIDPEIKLLANDLIEVMLDWEKTHKHELAAAIAAIQVGQPHRLIVIRTRNQSSSTKAFATYLNPEIVKSEGDTTLEAEGCLSVPEIYGLVPRADKIKVKAKTLDGADVRIEAEGFMARILQHEIDHLQGKLFIDKVVDNKYMKIDEAGELIPISDAELKQYSFLRFRPS